MICPKCGHERTHHDDPTIPAYQCPACDIVYHKYRPPQATPEPSATRQTKRHLISPKLLTIAIVMSIVTAINTQYTERIKATELKKQQDYQAKSQVLMQQQQLKKQEEKRKADCEQDAKCTGLALMASNAGVICQQRIEPLSSYSFKWTNGWTELILNHFVWKDNQHSSIVAFDDKLEIQNSYGAWENYVYNCEIRVSDGAVLDVKASPGRL